MRKLFVFVLLFCLFNMTDGLAAPFVVCDPQKGVTHYRVTGPAWVTANVTAQADGSIKMDIASAALGVNAITVSACISDSVWGERCSIPVPFEFTRPLPPASTKNTRLIP